MTKLDIKLLIRNSQLKSRAIKEGKDPDYYINLEDKKTNENSENNSNNSSSSRSNTFNSNSSSGPIPTDNQPEIKLILPANISNDLDNPLPVSNTVKLNQNQLDAVSLALSGKSFVLAGYAGTGKTFTVRYILEKLIENNKLLRMPEETKTLEKGDYGFIACAYTRRATSVVRQGLPHGLKASTCHALLEYAPDFYEDFDQDGNLVKKMRFVERRNRNNPIPNSVSLIVLDEASMNSVDLHEKIMAALPHRPQIIYIGDLAQLKPVFGDAILGYKLNELPVVELTQVYRQKDGEILDFATDIRQGKNLTNFTLPEYKNERLKINQFRTPEKENIRLRQLGLTIQRHIDSNDIDPLAGDLILCPFNVGIGTNELNKFAADYYDQKNSRTIYPIRSGIKTHYFALGDKILVDRNDALIVDIKPNPKYSGVLPAAPSHKTNRWGGIRVGEFMEATLDSSDSETEMDDFEAMLMASGNQSLDDIDESAIKNEASHIIYYQFISPDLQQVEKYRDSVDKSRTESMSSAGDINKMELAYCISVHKSQGSQANHVMLILMKQHAVMLNRELLYTAVTRAAKRLTIYADTGCISKCIMNPSIKGNTLQEKAEFFKGRAKERQT